jgi:hypothetical protein
MPLVGILLVAGLGQITIESVPFDESGEIVANFVLTEPGAP